MTSTNETTTTKTLPAALIHLASSGELGAHRRAVETRTGKTLPQQPDRAVIAEIGGEIGQGVAAHPEDAAGAVAVAEHCLGGDQPGEPAIHQGSSGPLSRSAIVAEA